MRAVYYCRVSTEEESQKNALKNQIHEAENCIKINSWSLVDKYIDEGKSGTQTKQRDEFNRLCEDLKEDKFDIIVIKSQDRLMRNTKDWYLFVDNLMCNNKKLYFYLENKYYTPDDALITGIKAILAEEYSRELSKKINNAHRNRQKTGTSVIITSATWGYEKVNKEVVINEGEAQIVRLIYDLCIQGYGSRSISKELSNRGIMSRTGKEFAEVTIRRIIRNPLFKGTVVMNKRSKNFNTKRTTINSESEWIIHENVIPAIVPSEIWEEANKVMDTRSIEVHSVDDKVKKVGKNKGKFELSSKIFCGECGSVYWRRYRKNSKGEQIVDWSCSEYIKRGRKNSNDTRGKDKIKIKNSDAGCNNIHIKEQDLNNILIEVSKNIFGNNKKKIINKALSILKTVLSSDNIDKERILIDSDKAKIIKQKNLLMDKLLDGIIGDSDYKRKNTDLENKLQEIISKESILQEKEDKVINIDERISNIESVLEVEGTEAANLILMIEHVEKILIFSDRIKIYLDFYKPLFVGLNEDKSINNINEDYQYVNTSKYL